MNRSVYEQEQARNAKARLRMLQHAEKITHEQYLGNRVFPTLGAVVDGLSRGLRDLDRHPNALKSMACFDSIKTLCLTLN